MLDLEGNETEQLEKKKVNSPTSEDPEADSSEKFDQSQDSIESVESSHLRPRTKSEDEVPSEKGLAHQFIQEWDLQNDFEGVNKVL